MSSEYFKGFSSSDKPRTWAEWQAIRRKMGSRVFNSDIATQLRFRDRQTLGEDKFYAQEEEVTQADLLASRSKIEELQEQIEELTKRKRDLFGRIKADDE